MTNHLADARACAASASRSPSVATAVFWLTATCEQIIAHLEAHQTEASLRRGLADITAGRTVDLGSFAQPATAPSAAQQGDSGHGDGGEAVQAAMAVLRDEGADSEGGWHSWRCFDRERYPEPCDCTEPVARAAIAAAEPHIRAKTLAPIRAALANHPRCDIHPDGDPITCGCQRAVASVQAALDKENR